MFDRVLVCFFYVFCFFFFLFSFYFFFQAEDGIRDLVRSRGLGDVYKRQGFYSIKYSLESCRVVECQVRQCFTVETNTFFCKTVNECAIVPVSYTHLTPPTSDLV